MRTANFMSTFNFDEQRATLLAVLLIISSAFASSAIGKESNVKDGIWKSRGYGYLLKLEGEDMEVFDITSSTCVKNDAVTAAFKQMRHDLNDRLGSQSDQMRLKMPFEKQVFHFDVLPAMPSACVNNIAANPLDNFDVFAAYFAEHYAFFDIYNVSWPSRVAEYRELVTSETTDAELFRIFADLVAPIRDGHVSISANFDGDEHQFDAYPGDVALHISKIAKSQGLDPDEAFMGFVRDYWLAGINQDILNGQGKVNGNGYIQYGIVDNVGYVSVLAMGGFAGQEEFHEQEDLDVFNETFDDMIASFNDNGVEAVIIDLSINFGGYDFIGREIASRFAESAYDAYSLRAGDKLGGLAQQVRIEPHNGPRYFGPVALVTTSQTVSAAEISTMALRALPNVQHVGMPTAGALSTTLNKQLPNGWSITLSNEIYEDHEGILWEGKGIPPHVELSIFDFEKLETSHPNAIRELISLIKNGNI